MRKQNCWPSPEQKLLLKAGLLDNENASAAWAEYCQRVDLQTVDYVSTCFFPLIFNNFKQSHTTQLQTCKSMYRYTWSANNLQFFKVKKALEALQSLGINICLLKGAAMIAGYYQDPGVRVIGDIDILIPRDQAAKAIGLLMSLDWTVREQVDISRLDILFNRTHGITFTHPDGGIIDLHWAILSGEVNKTLTKYTHRTRSIVWPQNKMTVEVLCPEDQLIHTLCHGLKYSPNPLIRWIPDASFILKNSPEFDWNYFLSQAKSLKMEYIMKTAITYLHQNNFAEIPSEIVNSFNQYVPSKHEINHFNLMTQKPRKFFYIIQLFWSHHSRNSSSQNTAVLLLTLPQFLKEYWRFKSWHQVPLFLGRRILFHFKKDCLSKAG
ncbi:MAG: hypothetical protein K0R66_1485 [Gammaproteobacteria bacterium]|jgi:hypothetical protein|nr:hypothetical protein [Gammaproteobacteria bacterium]